MLRVLIKSASLRRFYLVLQHMFSWKKKKNIGTFSAEESAISGAMYYI